MVNRRYGSTPVSSRVRLRKRLSCNQPHRTASRFQDAVQSIVSLHNDAASPLIFSVDIGTYTSIVFARGEVTPRAAANKIAALLPGFAGQATSVNVQFKRLGSCVARS